MALVVLTAGAILSLVLAWASAGHVGAIGVTIALAAALVMLVVHALMYVIAYSFGRLTRATDPSATAAREATRLPPAEGIIEPPTDGSAPLPAPEHQSPQHQSPQHQSPQHQSEVR